MTDDLKELMRLREEYQSLQRKIEWHVEMRADLEKTRGKMDAEYTELQQQDIKLQEEILRWIGMRDKKE